MKLNKSRQGVLGLRWLGAVPAGWGMGLGVEKALPDRGTHTSMRRLVNLFSKIHFWSISNGLIVAPA
jgi:hypothetical protein